MKQDEIFEYVDAYRWAKQYGLVKARERLREVEQSIARFEKTGIQATGRLKATRLGYRHAIDWLLTGKDRKRDVAL